MIDPLTPLKQVETDAEQALRFHSRERRRSLAGIPELFRTHRLFGAGVMEIPQIGIALTFDLPQRSAPVTFRTAIRITENSGVHRGCIFEFGGSGRACFFWVQDDGIGFRAGGSPGTNEEAVMLFDNGGELPVGAELDLVICANPGNGKMRLWSNGIEIARAQAVNETFGGTWAGTAAGSFAAAPFGSSPSDVPTNSKIAPSGFEVIEPLSIYAKQTVRQFV